MASSKVMHSSNSRNSDLSSHTNPQSSQMTFFNNTQFSNSTLLDAQITLIDTPTAAFDPVSGTAAVGSNSRMTAEEVWRDIVAGGESKEVKEEPAGDEMMTLEDFLIRNSAEVDDEEEEVEVKLPPAEMIGGSGSGFFGFDSVMPSQFVQPVDGGEGSVVGRGRRGRGGAMFEPMDRAAEQRQRRMIKNRESAARSRERKQAYQNELECLAARLEEENIELKKEKAEKTRKRLQQLKDNIFPVEEKRRPVKALRRANSWTCMLV